MYSINEFIGNYSRNSSQLPSNFYSSEKAGKAEALLFTEAQSLTAAQKLQALKNIGYPLNNSFHRNAIYRGASLGTAVTDEQWARISAGTFEDMYLGDYWTINGTTYLIGGFDYYYKKYSGSGYVNKHHLLMVPASNMYSHVMNDTATTAGGYVGSKMFTEGLTQATTTIETDFGTNHLLTVYRYLTNAVTDGAASGWSGYQRTVDLMTEAQLYGTSVWGNSSIGGVAGYNIGYDYQQIPLFAIGYPQNYNSSWFWLRDVVSAAAFANCFTFGLAACLNASASRGVRPCFSVS